MRLADATTIKIVTLPTEHGASVMLGESLLAGLLIAASGKGFLPALAWLFLFLMSHPLKIAIKDISHHVFTPRTSVAVCFCTGFGILALGFFTATYLFCGNSFLLIFAGAIPLGVFHLWAVLNAGKKEILAELSGVLSLGAAAASILLATGHPMVQALVLWLVLAIRGLTSVIYVRERLDQSRNKKDNSKTVVLVHVMGMMLLGLLVLNHLAKPLIFIAGLLLILRLWFMYQKRPITPRNLGIQESIGGIAYVVLVAFSFR